MAPSLGRREPGGGVRPWVAFVLLDGPLPAALAVTVALAISLAVLLVERLLRVRSTVLGLLDLATFTGFLVVILLAGPRLRDWVDTWFGDLVNGVLVVSVAVSLLCRVPLVAQYAGAPKLPYASSPWWPSSLLTAGWGLAFLVAPAAGFVGDHLRMDDLTTWTGSTLQVLAALVALQLTLRSSSRATGPADGRVSAAADLLRSTRSLTGPICGYLILVGVLSLAVGGIAHPTGWVLVLLAALLVSLVKAASTPH